MCRIYLTVLCVKETDRKSRYGLFIIIIPIFWHGLFLINYTVGELLSISSTQTLSISFKESIKVFGYHGLVSVVFTSTSYIIDE